MSNPSSHMPLNPYSSSNHGTATSSGDDAVYQALARVLHHTSPDTLSRFQSIMNNRAWTLRWAEKLVEGVLIKRDQEALVRLLADALPKWDDVVVYALVAANELLLPTLIQFAMENKKVASDTCLGLAALAHVWEALDRLQLHNQQAASPYGRVEAAWWFRGDEQQLTQLAHMAVELLLQRSDLVNSTAQTSALDPLASYASFLCSLLKHNVKDWVYDLECNNALSPLIHQLLQDTQPLEDHATVCTSTIRMALLAVSLICMLQMKHDVPQLNFAPSGGVVDHVTKVAFHTATSSSSPSGPRWTNEPVASSLRLSAQSLVEIWSLSQQQEPSKIYWPPFVEAAWRACVESSLGSEDLLSGLLLLISTSSCRLGVRRCLNSILLPTSDSTQQSDSSLATLLQGCRVLIASLLNYCQHNNLMVATTSASLLHSLLSDRQDVATHDELSRALWSAVSSFPLERLLDGVVKLSTSSRACQPLLLHMMDTVDLIMCYADDSSAFFSKVGRQRVDSLIGVMSSGGTTPGASANGNARQDEDETPPTNNLSRLGDSQASSFLSYQESRDCHGLDRQIKMAAATSLARMGYSDSSTVDDENSELLRSRIRSALYDYVAGLGIERTAHETSYTYTCRSVRLYALLGSCSRENEALIASVVAESNESYRKELNDRRQDLRNQEQQLEKSRQHAQATIAEKNKYKSAIRSQAVVLERDANRRQKQVTTKVEQLVELHASERARAEARLEKVLSQAKEVEAMRVESVRQAEASRAAEGDAKTELRETVAKLEAVQSELNEGKALEVTRRAEWDHAQQELCTARDALQGLETRYDAGCKELHTTQRDLSEMKNSYGHLQDELEVVFSNLSALAQIYEAKETEVATIVELKDRAVQEARRQSDEEIQRNEELAENLTRVELENDRLKKKLARAKEKLERERQARQDDEARRKRSGPISYINQMHSSRSSERSTDRSDKDSRSERKALAGKENSRSHSSSSRDYSRSARS